ncbi:MAG: response regulator transcription factor [Ruminococcaceae bacterium]|nr:response regulator transcription factor [Oscillospiraceae bacterium]
MAHILIADDEPRVCDLIEKYAVFSGFTVTKATNGEEAVNYCRQTAFDLVIMDVMMPKLDGFSACREIRSFCDVPILMLSARGEEYDRIRGFEIGVDDYVVKPFSPRELMLRADAILKRYRREQIASDMFTYEGLTIDFTALTVTVDGQRVELSPKERELLFYLVKNKNIALTREKLLTHVWGYDFYGDDRTLDTHIKLLRKSLKDYSRLVVTVRGVGYRFEIQT